MDEDVKKLKAPTSCWRPEDVDELLETSDDVDELLETPEVAESLRNRREKKNKGAQNQ